MRAWARNVARGTYRARRVLVCSEHTRNEVIRVFRVPARKIGMERDIGSLEPGKFADFLVFSANPLDDIRNTARLHYTVKNGFVYDAESMTQVWPARKELSRFFWQTPEDQQRFAPPRPKDLK